MSDYSSSEAIKKVLESFSKQIRDNSAFLKDSPRYLEVSIAYSVNTDKIPASEGFDIYRACSYTSTVYIPKKANKQSKGLIQKLLRKVLVKHYGICKYLQSIGSKYPNLSVLELLDIEEGVKVRKVYLNEQLSIEIVGAKDVLGKLGFIEVDQPS